MSQPATSPTAPGLALNLDDIHGGLYVSTHIVAALWGVLCMQSFTYYVKYTTDYATFKFLVAGLWLLSTLQAACVIKPEYIILVKNWGNAEALAANSRDGAWQVLLANLTAMLAQGFFTYRLYIFSNKKRRFPMIFVPAIFAQFAAATVDFYYVYHANIFEKFSTNSAFHIAGILSNIFPVVIDTGIAACMTYWLIKESRDSARRTRNMVVRLIILTINSGFWTASVALGSLITFLGSKVQTFGAVYYVLCTLYCNTVLANLNARESVRRVGTLGSGLNFETWHDDHSPGASRGSFEQTSPESSQPRDNKSNRPIT